MEGSGIMRTVFHITKKDPDAKDRLKIVTDLCDASVNTLRWQDFDAACKKYLPDDVGDYSRSNFKKGLEHAARSAWFNRRIQSHGVVNMGVPLRALLLLAMEGREAADSHLRKAGVTDEDFIQDILSTDQDTLTTLADNFGWLVNAGEFFKEAGKGYGHRSWLGLQSRDFLSPPSTPPTPLRSRVRGGWAHLPGRVRSWEKSK